VGPAPRARAGRPPCRPPAVPRVSAESVILARVSRIRMQVWDSANRFLIRMQVWDSDLGFGSDDFLGQARRPALGAGLVCGPSVGHATTRRR
jgi:hypothetical protein